MKKLCLITNALNAIAAAALSLLVTAAQATNDPNCSVIYTQIRGEVTVNGVPTPGVKIDLFCCDTGAEITCTNADAFSTALNPDAQYSACYPGTSTNYYIAFNSIADGGFCPGCSTINGLHFGSYCPSSVFLRAVYQNCTQYVACDVISNAYFTSQGCPYGGGWGGALVNVDIPCNPHTSPCPPPNAFFGLGPAGQFSVLGLAGAYVDISEGATTITGDVGVGPHDTADLLKATIKGTLYLDPTATPNIHPDLTVTGGTVSQDLSAASTAAISASANLAGLAPTQIYGNVNTSRTFVGNGGINVISLASVNLVKGTIIVQGGPSDVFVFNVAGGFSFSSSQMKLQGGVTFNNILWNFPAAGSGDINIFKDVTVAYGIFLAPNRNVTIDHTVTTGSVLSGGQIRIHSGATEGCPGL